MATKTLRPLKKGDPCWIRPQGKGNPVLAEYGRRQGGKNHSAYVGKKAYFVCFCRKKRYLVDYDAIFVAKPIPEETQ